jgi:hypothetical protein
VDLGGFDLEAAGSEASWVNWTNCTNCTPSTFQRVAVGSRFGVRLTTSALPCSGACQFPGGYALSPAVSLTAGHRTVLVRLEAVASATGAQLKLIGQDSAGADVIQQDLAVPQVAGGAPQTRFGVFVMPATVTAVRVRLEQPTPNAQLTVDGVQFFSMP